MSKLHIILQLGFFFPFFPAEPGFATGRNTPFFGDTNWSCLKSSGSSVSGTSGSRMSLDT